MRVKVSGMLSMELAGDIISLQEKNGYLVLSMRTHVGSLNAGSVQAALTPKDLIDAAKLMLKPATLRYFFSGFGKSRKRNSSPFNS